MMHCLESSWDKPPPFYVDQRQKAWPYVSPTAAMIAGIQQKFGTHPANRSPTIWNVPKSKSTKDISWFFIYSLELDFPQILGFPFRDLSKLNSRDLSHSARLNRVIRSCHLVSKELDLCHPGWILDASGNGSIIPSYIIYTLANMCSQNQDFDGFAVVLPVFRGVCRVARLQNWWQFKSFL